LFSLRNGVWYEACEGVSSRPKRGEPDVRTNLPLYHGRNCVVEGHGVRVDR
jgi:hypothetical protein